MRAYAMAQRPSTKLGRKHAWEMGIKICSNKEAVPFWGPKRGKIWKIDKSLKVFA